jgi:hypothetical protein
MKRDTVLKIKAVFALTSLLVLIFATTWYGPLEGWKLCSPFSSEC